MYPLHFAGALMRAEDPREARNRAHLLAIREARDAARRSIEPVQPPIQIERIAVRWRLDEPLRHVGTAA